MPRLLVGALLACAALTACSTSTSGTAVGADTTTTRPSASGATRPTAASVTIAPPSGKVCNYRKSGTSAGKDVGLPPRQAEDKQAKVTLKTSQGDIVVALATDKAPCTTRNFAFLASKAFFDGSPCHRLTTSGIEVLQCGDPSGTGSGTPGYTIPDEIPTDLPDSGTPGTVVYPRGTVAMANAGPGTGGSQFFLVYGDSTLSPDYALIGTIDDAGLAVVDKVAAGGSDPDGDGKPKTPIDIRSAEAG